MKIQSSSEINRIKSAVPGYLWEEVFDYVYDDILMGITADIVDMHIDDYDSSWCEADYSARISREVDQLLVKYAEGLTSLLFANYSEE